MKAYEATITEELINENEMSIIQESNQEWFNNLGFLKFNAF